jgi:hypothetical protein
MGKGDAKLLFKEIIERLTRFFGLSFPRPAGRAGFGEHKIIAVIRSTFLLHHLSYGLAALFRCGTVIERTVQTTMEISSAKRALVPAADSLAELKLAHAGMARFHSTQYSPT